MEKEKPTQTRMDRRSDVPRSEPTLPVGKFLRYGKEITEEIRGSEIAKALEVLADETKREGLESLLMEHGVPIENIHHEVEKLLYQAPSASLALEEKEDPRKRWQCPHCGSSFGYYSRKTKTKLCRNCGYEWNPLD